MMTGSRCYVIAIDLGAGKVFGDASGRMDSESQETAAGPVKCGTLGSIAFVWLSVFQLSRRCAGGRSRNVGCWVVQRSGGRKASSRASQRAGRAHSRSASTNKKSSEPIARIDVSRSRPLDLSKLGSSVKSANKTETK